MKAPLHRRQQITNAVDMIAAKGAILSDPLLASIVYQHQYDVPIEAFLQLRSFMNINANVPEIAKAISLHSQTDFQFNPNTNIIQYSFTLKPELTIENAPEGTSKPALEKFARQLTNEAVKISKTKYHWKISFEKMESLFAFWRALTFVPFQNHFFKVSVTSIFRTLAYGPAHLRQVRKQQTTPTIHREKFHIQRKTDKSITFQLGKRIEIPAQAQDI